MGGREPSTKVDTHIFRIRSSRLASAVWTTKVSQSVSGVNSKVNVVLADQMTHGVKQGWVVTADDDTSSGPEQAITLSQTSRHVFRVQEHLREHDDLCQKQKPWLKSN